MNGHCGRYDLSVKCTSKSKQSQPSPLTLATESYGYALTGRVERLSANHPPVAPLRLQAYRDKARSLGYPLAVVTLGRSRQVNQNLRLSTGGNPWKIITGSDWQPGTLKTPSEYCRRAFYALSRHFPSTFWIPKKNENYRGVHDALRRCTFIHYLHMLIVPCQYLLWTLLVPKVATGFHCCFKFKVFKIHPLLTMLRYVRGISHYAMKLNMAIFVWTVV